MANKLARQFVPMIAADRIFVTERNSKRRRKADSGFWVLTK
jgi:hypothetical protein